MTNDDDETGTIENNVEAFSEDAYCPTTPNAVREYQAQLLLAKFGKRHGDDLNDAEVRANIEADVSRLLQLFEDGVEIDDDDDE